MDLPQLKSHFDAPFDRQRGHRGTMNLLILTLCILVLNVRASESFLNVSTLFSSSKGTQTEAVEGFFTSSGHSNNWAVLVCTSRFYYNYRHVANTLSMYRTVKRLGIPDSNIILMLADDVACNPRNKYAATVFNNNRLLLDLYGSNVEVDYRGYDVTVESFIRVLTGRHEPNVPRSKRLLTDDRSNVLIFMTGHGGDDFLKFQDAEEIGAQDIADAIGQMFEKKRYHELFFLIDTCQASTMFSKISSPNVLAAASSLKGESSYSHHASYELGVAVIDRFTYFNLEVLEKVESGSQSSLKDLFDTYNPQEMHSTPGIRTDLFSRPMTETLITDFFGSVSSIEMTLSPYKLDEHPGLLSAKSSLNDALSGQALRKESSRVLSADEEKRAQSAKWDTGTKEIDFTFVVGCLILWFFGSAALIPETFLKFSSDQ